MCLVNLVCKKLGHVEVRGSIHFGRILHLPKGGRKQNGILPIANYHRIISSETIQIK